MYVIECNILSYIVLIAEVEWFWLNRGDILVSNLIKKNRINSILVKLLL